MDESPLSVRITQGLLLLSTVVFSGIVLISFAFEPTHLLQFLYLLLLVALPITAFTALRKGKSWARNLATMALLCVWAFDVRMFLNIVRWDYFSEAVLAGSPLSVVSVVLFISIIALPFLVLKLNLGENESEFFADEGKNELSPVENRWLTAPAMPYANSAEDFVDHSITDRR